MSPLTLKCPDCPHQMGIHTDQGCRICAAGALARANPAGHGCRQTTATLRVVLQRALAELGGHVDPALIVHFGVYPHGTGELHVAGHGQTKVEYRFADRFVVSGSWGCWGPDDQDTDGDDSLHVLAELYPGDYPEDLVGMTKVLETLHRAVRSAVASGRMHPWGTITTTDHSETVYVWTTEHHGGIRVFQATDDPTAVLG